MIVIQKLLGNQNVVTNAPPWYKSSLRSVNEVRQDGSQAPRKNLGDALVDHIATGDGVIVLECRGVRGLRYKRKRAMVELLQESPR